MITMAVIALLGVLCLAGLLLFFFTRQKKNMADVRQAMDREVATILARDADNDHDLAEAVERGVLVDQALKQYQQVRTALIPIPAKTTEPWNWDENDLKCWSNQELISRGEKVNLRLMLPAAGSSLAVIAVTFTALAIVYHTAVSRPEVTPPNGQPSLDSPSDPLALPAADLPAAADTPPSTPPPVPSAAPATVPSAPPAIDPVPAISNTP